MRRQRGLTRVVTQFGNHAALPSRDGNGPPLRLSRFSSSAESPASSRLASVRPGVQYAALRARSMSSIERYDEMRSFVGPFGDRGRPRLRGADSVDLVAARACVAIPLPSSSNAGEFSDAFMYFTYIIERLLLKAASASKAMRRSRACVLADDVLFQSRTIQRHGGSHEWRASGEAFPGRAKSL